MDLDRIDFEILYLLRNNARLMNKEIATRVGIAPSTCLSRIRNLQSGGVLRGFHADINPDALGIGLQAMIAIRLRHRLRQKVEAFSEYTLALPEVIQLYHVAGPTDFQVHVWVTDAKHLQQLAVTAFIDREEVEHIETGLIFEHSTSSALPCALDWPEPDFRE
jgi:DNA-binding Lrp family transcriptional regulator